MDIVNVLFLFIYLFIYLLFSVLTKTVGLFIILSTSLD